LVRVLALVVLLVAGVGWFAWYKLLREEPEPAFASEIERFKYGSTGGEQAAGFPYWIWVVLPRIFPEYLPGPGGYKSLGLIFEDSHDLPVGFTRKTVGFPRTGNNCALCHTTTYRATPDSRAELLIGAPAHSLDVQRMIRFLLDSAADPRFNADVIMPAIAHEVQLSWIDRQVYRYAIIPLTRRAMKDQARQLAWMSRPGVPPWGPGRDDAFNLPKYVVAKLPPDGSVGQCDLASVWNLKARKGEGRLLNWGGETPSVRSVVVDSAMGTGARPGHGFEARMEWLDRFMSDLPAPRYPFPIDAALAAAGKPVYDRSCAGCHEPGEPKTSHVIPIAEIGTDRERFDTWTQGAADAFNAKMSQIGFSRPPVGKRDGYLSSPLDGIWARAPYLHNGSVPNLRELLEPAPQRSRVFYRGYDVYDPAQVGFVSSGPDAERAGWKHDTAVRGDGNGGHAYGTELDAETKRALLEYLKTK
jgi:mono/diheme cytochrome c family protein